MRAVRAKKIRRDLRKKNAGPYPVYRIGEQKFNDYKNALRQMKRAWRRRDR